jgi:UDP-2-acetamido-2,6-beta-L-arabino-hexul-4-ose reductase
MEEKNNRKKLEIKGDERGNFVEVFKIPEFGQVSFSTTKPGIVRGNHYHTRKKEIFCVIEGKAKIKQRNIKTGEVEEAVVSGEIPELVEMKLNWTHNIQNIGDKEMKLLIWISEVYNQSDPDTFFEEV